MFACPIRVAPANIALLLCCLFGEFAQADEAVAVHPFLTDKFNIQLGIYSPQKDIFVRVDGSLGGENIGIDFDESLGVGKSDEIFAAEFVWRFGEKWSLRSQYFDAAEQKSAVLTEDIEWGDIVIQEGSSVTAGTNLTLSRLFFGRSLDSSPKYDYGLGLGIHWLDTGAFVKLDSIISFGETSAVRASGPLPNIGTWFYYSPSAKWFLGGRLDWFKASVGDYAGSIINVALGVNYQFTEHLGAGVSYQEFELNADIDSDSWRGRLNTDFAGLFFYLSGNW